MPIQFESEQDKQEFLSDFIKRFALCASDKVGEAESAFRKSALLCERRGFPLLEVVALAYGGDGALQDDIERERAEHAGHLEQAAAEIMRLRERLARASGESEDGEHVIDLPGRLRRAWTFPHFRLFLLAVLLALDALAVSKGHALPARLFGVMALSLVVAWSLAQFRKRGLGQLFLKWLLFGAIVAGGSAAINAVEPPHALWFRLGVVAVALVLTVSKVTVWAGEWIRAHVWESSLMQKVRGWFA